MLVFGGIHIFYAPSKQGLDGKNKPCLIGKQLNSFANDQFCSLPCWFCRSVEVAK